MARLLSSFTAVLLAVVVTVSLAAPQDTWPTCDLCHSAEECGIEEGESGVGRIAIPELSSGRGGSVWQYHLNNEIPLSAIVSKSTSGCTLYIQREPSSALHDPLSGHVIPANAKPFFWFYFQSTQFTSFGLDFDGVPADPEGILHCKRDIPSCDPSALIGVSTYFF